MATVSFKETAPEAATQAPATESKIVPAGDSHPVAVTKSEAMTVPAARGITGEITMRDIQLPRVNLVQKIGELADSGLTPGVFMLNKEAMLSDGKTPLSITVLRLHKQYRQKLEQGDQSMPQVYDKQEQVIANGGSLKWGEPNYFQEIAHLSLAIEKPANLKEEFAAFFYREHASKQYTLAVYTVASSAFTSLGKKIITAGYNQLSSGLWTGKWQLTSSLTKGAKGTWFIPEAKFDGLHSKEDAAFFESMVANTQ
jgi:hypothetical protein